MTATTRTPEKTRLFLKTLIETCNVSRACNAIGEPRSTVYDWRAADSAFGVAWDEAKAIGADVLEDEAVRRAHEGVEEPVFYQGDEVTTVTKYSDTLLIFLLNGAKPDKYRQRTSAEISGPNGAPIAIDDATASDKIAAILAAAQGRKAQDVSDLA